MVRKSTVLVVAGVSYVLGARAGRQRYEQFRRVAMNVKSNPKVRESAHNAAEAAKGAASSVTHKVADAADSALIETSG
jgi:hypothetical protein